MPAPLCKNCNKRHYGSCPLWDRKPIFTPFAEVKEKVIEAAKPKKPWVKPTLTKVHLIPAVSLTETKAEVIQRLKDDGVSLTKGEWGGAPPNVSLTRFDRKTYQRDYMRKKRAKEC